MRFYALGINKFRMVIRHRSFLADFMLDLRHLGARAMLPCLFHNHAAHSDYRISSDESICVFEDACYFTTKSRSKLGALLQGLDTAVYFCV